MEGSITEVERVGATRKSGDIALQIALISTALLIPCFWQRRIQAMDLSSHIYNSWLAQQIELGKAPGLTIVPMTTNVLFDWILSWLFERFGPEPAQRIAVSACVLIFFWGAMAFIRAVSGNRAWFLIPCMAMLTYGWVFHAGFFNYYLALGLCLWAMTALRWRGWRKGAAALLFPLAYLAHPLPPAWAAAMCAYFWIHSRTAPRLYPLLMATAIAAIVALRYVLFTKYAGFSSVQQILESVAIDQFWVFGIKFCAISLAVALTWSFMLLRATHELGWKELLRKPVSQACILMAAGILLLPTSIGLPSYDLELSFITERMTLAYAVILCAFLAGCNPPAWQRRMFLPIAALFFTLIYIDTRALNRTEREMEQAVSHLTLKDRLVTAFHDPTSRVQLWTHVADRVCVGKCLSYSNFEPFTKAFRIRPTGESPLVLTTAGEVGMVDAGLYRVKPRDLPIHQLGLCGPEQRVCLKTLQVGDQVERTRLSVLPLWW